MELDTFLDLVARLTGTPVKDPTETDRHLLRQILVDPHRRLDCSQLNELLLLANKDRVELPFFEYFFGRTATIAGLPDGVEKFQKTALLVFGNFIYAYRRLSKLTSTEELVAALGQWAIGPDERVRAFRNRSPKLLDIESIPQGDTHLVGYLSPALIVAEAGRAEFFNTCFDDPILLYEPTWEGLDAAVQDYAAESERPAVKRIIANYRLQHADSTAEDFREALRDALPTLQANEAKIVDVQSKAARNQDIYLTWDHMDVYFATSMRKRWEYEDLYAFVQDVMTSPKLGDLNLRYFDPTQAYTKSRIDKGLVESLMLKRAKCTVYSVQDTDTLGKDSELAATLAQGKPVIAYVPTVNVAMRTSQLLEDNPATIEERLRFVLHADEGIADAGEGDREVLATVGPLTEHVQQQVWRTIPSPAHIQRLRDEHGGMLGRLCEIIARAEARIYNKRAKTLTDTHPLAIQVHLETGVANGVLVVRTAEECAELLHCLLTNRMKFELEDKDNVWYLRESISKSIFRVVTKDRKLTNCFWNFYRQQD